MTHTAECIVANRIQGGLYLCVCHVEETDKRISDFERLDTQLDAAKKECGRLGTEATRYQLLLEAAEAERDALTAARERDLAEAEALSLKMTEVIRLYRAAEAERDAALAELKAEREAHARTQHWLDDFQGTAAASAIAALPLENRVKELETELSLLRERYRERETLPPETQPEETQP